VNQEFAMRLITTIVRPERLPEVKAALFRAGVTGITLSRVTGHGGERGLARGIRAVGQHNDPLVPRGGPPELREGKGKRVVEGGAPA